MLKLSQPNISEDAISAVGKVLRSGQLVHGQESEEFEKELANYLGCHDVVLVSSGAAALHLALLVLDIGPGDAVIVPDFTFPATANVIAMVGARPVIVDVLPNTYTLDPKKLEDVVSSWSAPERLRAIMPVHEFGCLADMKAINKIAKQNELFVIEDAACALGADLDGQKAGNFGDLGCFSFHPRKTLTTGEGGAIATNNSGHASRLRRLRSHGMERAPSGVYFHETATNYRLTNFQAALGRNQLPYLDSWIEKRRQLAKEYLIGLKPLVEKGWLQCPAWVDGHSWQTFMVVLDPSFNRNQVIEDLKAQDVEANLGAQSLSNIGLYGKQFHLPTIGPELYRSGLALPMYESMSFADVESVICAITKTL